MFGPFFYLFGSPVRIDAHTGVLLTIRGDYLKMTMPLEPL